MGLRIILEHCDEKEIGRFCIVTFWVKVDFPISKALTLATLRYPSHSKIKSNLTNSYEFVFYHLKMNQAKHDANFTIHRATNVITAINYLADKYYPV